jgi:hypothetical protein
MFRSPVTLIRLIDMVGHAGDRAGPLSIRQPKAARNKQIGHFAGELCCLCVTVGKYFEIESNSATRKSL